MSIISFEHSMVAIYQTSEMQSSMEEHELMGEELSVADAVRRLRMMGEIEADYAPAAPALAPAPVAPGQPSTRAKITEWFCQMGESFELSTHTVGIACNFLDRTLAARECSAVQFQLVAVTALLLAAKLEERKPITLNDLVVLSSGLFARDDIRLMELEMLRILKWRLAPPTVAAFVDLLLVLEPRRATRRRVAALAVRFVHLGYVHDGLRDFEPSTLAVAAVMCAYREAGEPVASVETFTTVVKRCAFAYLRAPGVRDRLFDAGVKLLSAAKGSARAAAPPLAPRDDDVDITDSFSEDESDVDDELPPFDDRMDEDAPLDKELRVDSPDTVATEFFGASR